MSANDIRELENLDRIPEEKGGGLYLVNGNMVPLTSAGAAYATTETEESAGEKEKGQEQESEQTDGLHERRRKRA